MKHSCPPARECVAAARLDRYLTSQLRKTPGFETVSVSAGYRLRAPDEEGCNWSGDVVPMFGPNPSHADIVCSRLRPIVKAAKARFNLSE